MHGRKKFTLSLALHPRSGIAFLVLLAAFVAFFHAAGLAYASDSRLQEAEAFASEGKFSDAASLLLDVVEADGSDVEARLALARILRDAGYYFFDNELLSQSLTFYDQALEIDSAQLKAMYGKAVLLYESGRYAEALELFERLLASAPNEEPKSEGLKTASKALLKNYKNASGWGKALKEMKEEDREKLKHANKCDLCWSPLGDESWELGDGRTLCGKCFAGALNDENKLKDIYDQVVNYVEDSLGLRLAKRPSIHLVSADEMSKLAGDSLHSFEGVKPENLAGLFTQSGDEPNLYILRGLPADEATGVIAHEYAHAWSRANCPPDTSLSVNEGFSQWAAYEALLALNRTEAAQRMFLEQGPYGVNFKRMEVVARIRGAEGLLALVKEGGL